MTYGNGDSCGDSTYQITYEVECDERELGQPASSDFFYNVDDACSPQIVFYHETGCPYADLTAWLAFVRSIYWLYGILALVLGVAIGLQGGKYPALVGFISTFTWVMIMANFSGSLDAINPALPKGEGSVLLAILATLISLVLGAAWVALCYYSPTFNLLQLAYYLWVSAVACTIYSLVFFNLTSGLFFNTWCTCLGVLGGFVAYFLRDSQLHLQILISSLGSYVTFCGIAAFL